MTSTQESSLASLSSISSSLSWPGGMSRPHIIFDVDNVLYPWTLHMAHLVGAYTAQDPDMLVDSVRSWHVEEDWNVPSHMFNRLWDDAIKDGSMYYALGPSSTAMRALYQLSEADWHIHLVTARLNRSGLHENVIDNTVRWLSKFKVPFRGLSFEENKHLISADVIVDDKPANLIDHPAPMRFLFPGNHNAMDRESEEYVALDDDDPWTDLLEALHV